MPRTFLIFLIKAVERLLLTSIAAFKIVKLTLFFVANKSIALVSCGRAGPPNPTPEDKYLLPIRGSSPIPKLTSWISALTASHKSEISLMYDNLTAK